MNQIRIAVALVLSFIATSIAHAQSIGGALPYCQDVALSNPVGVCAWLQSGGLTNSFDYFDSSTSSGGVGGGGRPGSSNTVFYLLPQASGGSVQCSVFGNFPDTTANPAAHCAAIGTFGNFLFNLCGLGGNTNAMVQLFVNGMLACTNRSLGNGTSVIGRDGYGIDHYGVASSAAPALR